ncbi:hypothetical protein [uncultured Jatrophihabitans sp.]|uniref:hypothetical protein n=1 Tax=uncultured Jatrophihabitans sp. TaxID=1610747 RepID=UPI0035CA09F8
MSLGSPRAPASRALRAAVFAFAGTGLGVAAHRLGGGMTPPAWLTIASVLGLFALAFALTGAQRRLPVITGLVLMTQTAMHVGFTAVGMRAIASPTAASGERSLLSMVLCHNPAHTPSAREVVAARATLASLHVSAPAATQATTMPAGSMLTPSMAWMLAAHLLAATVMAWWLARGERAVWRCARRVVQTIQAVAEGFPTPAATTVRGVAVSVVPSLRTRWRMLCAPGRAPPAPRSFSLLPAAS